MWFLFHRKAKTKAVPDGELVHEHCPTCRRTTLFHEVEVTKKYGVFFVDMIDDRERLFLCTGCGETYERVVDEAAPVRPPPKTGMDRVEELAAEQRRRDASKAQMAAKIDDELAELKRRMGRA